MHSIVKNILEGGRLSYEEGIELLVNGNWLELAEAAWQYRCELHGSENASYTMFRVVNYTNICNVDCKFCSFQRKDMKSKSAYVLSLEEVSQKVEEAIGKGADQMFFQGGVHPELPYEYYLEIFSHVKKEYGIHIRAFSPVEILNLVQITQQPIEVVLQQLKNAGVDSIPGAGAELLVERMRKMLSPLKCTTEEWCNTMVQCHENELTGSATMVVGGGETLAEIIAHLEQIRTIQDRTGGFHSFIPWTYQQQTKRFRTIPMRPDEFLKILAVSRLYLDNIRNLEVSVMVLGRDLGKIALRMGANDVSSAVLEENVLKSYGLRNEKEAVEYLESAGFHPVRRNFDYEMYLPYSSPILAAHEESRSVA